MRSSFRASLTRLVTQAEESRPVPPGASDRKGNVRQAWITLPVPGKAIGKHGPPLHLPLPFAAKHCPGPEVRSTPAKVHGALAGLLGRAGAVEQASVLVIEVA